MSTLMAQELQQHEQVIDRGIQTFVEVGTALALISEKRLYKSAGYKSFRAYLGERYPQLGPKHAYRLIAAAAVTEELKKVSPMGDSFPAIERVARPLVKLQGEPENLREAWETAVASADGQQPTMQQVEEAVSEVLDRDRLRGKLSALGEMRALTDKLVSDVEAYRPASDFSLFHEEYAAMAAKRPLPPADAPVSADSLQRLEQAAGQYEQTARAIRAFIEEVQ